MKKMRILQIILLFLSFGQIKANAWEITALGGFNYASPTDRQGANNYSWTSTGSFSYGLTVSEEVLNPHFELETGILSLSESIEGSIINVDTTETMQALQIPFLIRYHFDPWVSIAFGGYYSFGQGTVDTTQAGTTTRQSYSAAGLTSNDAGLTISLKAKLHFNQAFALVIDGRYEHGLKNQAQTPGDVFNTRSIQILAGVGFEFY